MPIRYQARPVILGGYVVSFEGRVGDVTSQYGDYTATEIEYNFSWNFDTIVDDNVGAALDYVGTKVNDDLTYVRGDGTWDGQEYPARYIVNDGGWLMVSNKTTLDRPAPQPNGSPQLLYGDTPAFVTNAQTAVVYTGHRYQFNKGKSGWIGGLRVWVPTLTSDTNYRFVIVDNTDPANPQVGIIEEPILNANAWTTIALETAIATAGTDLTIFIDALNSGSTTVITGGWTYQGASNAAPPAQNWNRTNQQNILRIDKTDLDSTDRTSELLSVIPNSTIRVAQTSNLSFYWEYTVTAAPTDSGTDVEYQVTLVDTGGSGVGTGETTTITIDIPVQQSTDYVELTDFLLTQPDYATVTGRKQYDGVDQPSANNGYGVDIVFQEAQLSDDWDLLSNSTQSSGGISGSANRGDPVVVDSSSQLTAKDFTIQAPTGTGIGNEVQIKFGSAQLPELDSNGTYTAQEDGQKTFTVSLNASRANNGGEAYLWVYTKLNGSATGAQLFIIDDTRIYQNYTFTVNENLLVGDTVEFYVFRQSGESNDGFLAPADSGEAIPQAPSAFLEVANLVIA